MEDLPNKIRDNLGIICDVDILSECNCDIIKITTFESPYPVNYKGEYHYRSGTTKQELKGAFLSRFLMQKTGLSWDSVPVANTNVNSFRNDSFDIFREQVRLSARMAEKDANVTNRDLAEKLELLDENGNVTRAGLLCFHHNPEKWVTGCWIKIGFFTNESTIVYQDEVHGSLMQQANSIIDLLYTKYLVAPITFKGITRVERYPYPKDAVREAILNAVVHKNYASFTPIQIRVYKEKMRIANDFILPPGITAAQLINEGKSRPANPKIANTFFRAGFIESWGRGIGEIRSICKTYGTKEPEFKVDQDCMFVTFFPLLEADSGEKFGINDKSSGEKFGLNADNVAKIINIMKDNSSVTLDEIAGKLGISRRAVEKHVKNLREMKKIRREGSNKSGKWIVDELTLN
jgi:ATP-dependent DNA helicase RecG